MVEDGDLPRGRRCLQPAGEPRGLPVTDTVRIEDEELEVAEPAPVRGPRHRELVVLVAAVVDDPVVVAERPCGRHAGGAEPSERARPVRVEPARTLGVVVVAERDERVRRMPFLEALHRRAHVALLLAADAEVADREDSRPSPGGAGAKKCADEDGGCEAEATHGPRL
jgi:hypothetical protein